MRSVSRTGTGALAVITLAAGLSSFAFGSETGAVCPLPKAPAARGKCLNSDDDGGNTPSAGQTLANQFSKLSDNSAALDQKIAAAHQLRLIFNSAAAIEKGAEELGSPEALAEVLISARDRAAKGDERNPQLRDEVSYLLRDAYFETARLLVDKYRGLLKAESFQPHLMEKSGHSPTLGSELEKTRSYFNLLTRVAAGQGSKAAQRLQAKKSELKLDAWEAALSKLVVGWPMSRDYLYEQPY